MLTALGITFTVALMLFGNAFYVAAEFSGISARKTRLMQLAQAGNYTAKLLLPIVEDNAALDRYVAASQVGISILSLILGAYGQNTVAPALAPLLLNLEIERLTAPLALSIATTAVLATLTVLQVVLGELLPKSLTLQFPERVALATALPMLWSLALFRPLIWLFNGSATLMVGWFGVNRAAAEHGHAHSAQEIELLVGQSYQGGLLNDESRQMLRNALRLRRLTARQVMIPRTRLVAAAADSTVSRLISLACDHGYSRIPLYQDTIDHIIGFAHLKDLFQLQLNGDEDARPALRQVLFVPEGLPVAAVWAELNKKRKYLAVVLDEFGGTAGLLTIEDLVEEIFGELLDEFDREQPLSSIDKLGHLHLRADLLITDVNEYLSLNLPSDAADTLGGLVFNILSRAPVVGDAVMAGEPPIAIRVEAVTGLQIMEVSLSLPAQALPHITEWRLPDHD